MAETLITTLASDQRRQFGNRKICRNSAGTIVAVYSDGLHGPIRYRLSTDNGASWGSEQTVLSSARYNDFNIYLNPINDDIYVGGAENQSASTDYGIIYNKLTWTGSTYTAGTEQTIDNVGTSSSVHGPAFVALSSTNILLITGEYNQNNSLYSKSTDGGSTWADLDLITGVSPIPTGRGGSYLIQSSSNVALMYRSWKASWESESIRLGEWSYTWSTDTWSFVTSIADTGVYPRYRISAAKSGDHIFVATTISDDYSGLKVFHYNGSSWDTGTEVADTSYRFGTITITSEEIYAFYFLGAGQPIYYKKANISDDEWSSQQTLVTGSFDRTFVQSPENASTIIDVYYWHRTNDSIYHNSLYVPQQQTINSDAEVTNSIKEKYINSDAHIKSTDNQETIDSDAEVALKSVVFDDSIVTSCQYTLNHAPQRKIVVTSTGKLVAFCGPNSNYLQYKVSNDEGLTWQNPTNISITPSWIDSFDIKIDSSDNIYLVYSLGGTGTYFIKLTYSGGNTWTTGTEYQVESNGYNIPVLALRSNGDIWVAVYSGSNAYMYYSTNSGQTWNTANLGSVGGNIGSHALLPKGSNIWYICTWYTGSYGQVRQFEYSTSWDTGTTVSSDAACWQDELSVTKISDSNIWISYMDNNWEWPVAQQYNGSWQSAHKFTDADSYGTSSTTIANVKGKIFLAACQAWDSYNIYFWVHDGSSWSSNVTVEDTPSYPYDVIHSCDNVTNTGFYLYYGDDSLDYIYFQKVAGDEQQTITSDAIVQGTTQQTIDSDAKIIESRTQQTIDSDAHIKVIGAQQTITSDAWMGSRSQETIDSDAHIMKIGDQKTIDSDAKIVESRNQETIDSDAKIIESRTQQTIDSDANVYGTTQQTIDSDALVVQRVQKYICSDAFIKYHKDFYARLQAENEDEKDFYIQLKVNQPTPTNPTGLTTTDLETGEALELTWTDTGNYGYNIYRDIGSVWVKQNDIVVDGESYIAGGLTAGVSYSFQVRGTNGAGDESSGVDTSGTPTFNLESYSTKPVWEITINGTPQTDAILEKVEINYGPTYSIANFYIADNPSNVTLNPSGQLVVVSVNGRVVLTGYLVKRTDVYNAQSLRVNYKVISKLWDYAKNTVGRNFNEPQGSASTRVNIKTILRTSGCPTDGLPDDKYLYGEVAVADLSKIELMETMLRYAGNYKIYVSPTGDVSYYKAGYPISNRTYEVGKHIIEQEVSTDITDQVGSLTVYSNYGQYTTFRKYKIAAHNNNPIWYYDDDGKKQLNLPQSYMIEYDDDGNPYIQVRLYGTQISGVEVYAKVNEKPYTVSTVPDLEVLPKHVGLEKWPDQSTNGRFCVQEYAEFSSSWKSVSASVDYSKYGNYATIKLTTLPVYYKTKIEEYTASFISMSGGVATETDVPVWIMFDPEEYLTEIMIIYTYKGSRLSKTVSGGSGLLNRTIHDGTVPKDVWRIIGYEMFDKYVRQSNWSRVRDYIDERAEAEFERLSKSDTGGSLSVLGDETLDLRTHVNGYEVSRIVHDFSNGFITHIDLTNEQFYRGDVVLKQKQHLILRTGVDDNDKRIITVINDLDRYTNLSGDSTGPKTEEPKSGAAHLTD